LGVSGEQGRATDIANSQEEHHHSLQANTTASVRWGAECEGVEVGFDGGEFDFVGLGLGLQHLRVVHSLRSRANLLTANEHIVAVGVSLVLGVGHGVEGTDGGGVLVQNKKVRVVLILHQLAKQTLLGGATE